MGGRLVRAAPVLGASLLLAVGVGSPGVAGPTTETTVAFAAESSTGAVVLEIPGTPGESFSLASTESTVTSQGPASSGFGQVLDGAPPTRAESQAPPDQSETAGLPDPPPGDVGGLIGFDLAAGTSSSDSKANGTVETANDATVAGITLENAGGFLFDFGASIGALTSESSAKGSSNPSASASASVTGLQIDVEVDLSAITGDPNVCTELGTISQQLGQLCSGLTQQTVDLLRLTIADGTCSASWDGTTPKRNGTVQGVSATILGLPAVDVGENDTQTIAGGTVLETTIGVGLVTQSLQNGAEGEEDSASVQTSGAQVSLFQGAIVLNVGRATCGVSGKITTTAVIARTGGEITPLMVGGPAMAAAGYGLRRFLRRGRRERISG